MTFLYGMAVCHWCWLNVVTFTILIWVFLPFYMRGNVATMPEFIERRYNRFCRYIYAVISLIGMVVAMLGGVMYAGGKAINAFFPGLPVWAAITLSFWGLLRAFIPFMAACFPPHGQTSCNTVC